MAIKEEIRHQKLINIASRNHNSGLLFIFFSAEKLKEKNMKIVRIKTGKPENKRDMFVVLCLIQSVAVILIVFMIFAVSRINGELFAEMKKDISELFSSDMDIGGYYTREDEISVQSTVMAVSSKESVCVSKESDSVEAALFRIREEKENAFDIYSEAAVMPVAGTVTSEYGYRIHPIYNTESFHSGRDIAASEGSNIYAVRDGKVTEASFAPSAGNYIKLDHGDGYFSLYCHCSCLYVSEGVNVRKGDVIAAVGQTGLATGPHLHFELHKNGEVLDPAIILEGAESVN